MRHIPVAEQIEIYNKLDDCCGELEGGIKDDSIISTLGGCASGKETFKSWVAEALQGAMRF